MRRARERAFTFIIARPDFDQPIGKLVRNFFQIRELAGPGRTFHFEIVAVIMVKLLERFD